MQGLVLALYWAGCLAYFEENPADVERLASNLIELSTRQNVGTWLPHGRVLRGWARSACGGMAEGVSWIEARIGDYSADSAILAMPFFLALKAEALHLAIRTSEALEATKEAEAMVERSEARVNVFWSAEPDSRERRALPRSIPARQPPTNRPVTRTA
jgi:hypothetical protein